jgi:hypothetical protein
MWWNTLDSSCLYLASDYSGDNSKYDFNVITMVVADFKSWTRWESHRREIRAKHFKHTPSRRMSFKDLNNDKCRQAALEPFLDAANQLNGICVTFAVRKHLQGIFDCPHSLEICRSHADLKANWKQKPFSRMLAIVQIVSFLVSSLAKQGQDVLWITDEDDIVANDLFKADVQKMLGNVMETVCMHALGKLEFATTALTDARRGVEDFVAIADLVAGATAEGFTSFGKCGPIPTGGESRLSKTTDISSKTKFIWNWLRPGIEPLKKLTCIVQPHGRDNKNEAEVGIFELLSYKSL